LHEQTAYNQFLESRRIGSGFVDDFLRNRYANDELGTVEKVIESVTYRVEVEDVGIREVLVECDSVFVFERGAEHTDAGRIDFA
jgi:hypothetical protein